MKTRRDIIIPLLVNIVLPSVLCFLFSYFFLYLKSIKPSPGFLVPMFFGTILGIFNYKYFKYKIYFNRVLQVILVCICVSYVCFIFSFFVIPIIAQFKDYIFRTFTIEFELITGSIFELYEFFSMYIIAPLTILLSFKCIFKFPKRYLTKIIFLVFLVFFLVIGYLLKFIVSSDTLQMLLWMPLVILPIQLILYQENIKTLLRLKNV